jgi:hypothetical protein
MVASARLHALVAEKLRRGKRSTGAACGEDGELLDASMERALHDAVLALARRGARCRGRNHVSKHYLPALRYWGPGNGGRYMLMRTPVERCDEVRWCRYRVVVVPGRWGLGGGDGRWTGGGDGRW